MILQERLQQLRKEIFKPLPKLTLSQWADQYRYLPLTSAEPGKWITSRAEYTREIMNAITNRRTNEVVVIAPSQSGKALDITTNIPTPQGYVPISDIEVGDVVFSMDGARTRVVGTTSVFENTDCYRVYFANGDDVVCSAEHLWNVQYKRPWTRENWEPRVFNTLQLFELLKLNKPEKHAQHHKFFVPVCGSIQTDEADLPIPPYTLGAWLGDGNKKCFTMTLHRNDWQIIEEMTQETGWSAVIQETKGNVLSVNLRKNENRIETRLPRVRTSRLGNDYYVNGYVRTSRYFVPRQALQDNNLLYNKHIPKTYLRASYEQRVALLQGLMDTDGTISKLTGECSITTTIPQLMEDICELVVSLGMKYRLRDFQPICKGWGVPKRAYSISFRPYMPVFRLERKRKYHKDFIRPFEITHRKIIKVERVPTIPTRCIQTESGTFLFGKHMIPTHNSEILLNALGYYVDQDPSSILVIQPNLEMADSFSKERIALTFDATPVLQDKLRDKRERDSGNTIRHKSFPGGFIALVGSNSASGLASRPIRVLLADEIDRYGENAQGEGNPLELARKRTQTFENRRKMLLVSSPGLKETSLIEPEYERSTRDEYHIPCIKCEEYFVPKWPFIIWEKDVNDEPIYETARLQCPHCGHLHDRTDRDVAVRNGKWQSRNPERAVRGFHFNALISPWVDFSELVKEWYLAQRNINDLKVFINTRLAETFEEGGEEVDELELLARREPYTPDSIPNRVEYLTAGVDIQKDRIELEVVGWGADDESWNISYEILHGDPTTPAVWNTLKDHLLRSFTREDGLTLKIEAAAIDTGMYTQHAYAFCEANRARRFFPIKGGSRDKVIFPKKPSRTDKGRVYLISTDVIKDMLYGWLRIQSNYDEPTPGYSHFPEERDAEYFMQLTSEKRKTKYRRGSGIPIRIWTLKPGVRNEALDCRVYAIAAKYGLNVPIDAVRKRNNKILQAQEEMQNSVEAPAKTPRRPIKNKWMSGVQV